LKRKKTKDIKKGQNKSLHDSLTNIQSTCQVCDPNYGINCFTLIFLLLCNKKNIKVIIKLNKNFMINDEIKKN